MADSYRVVRNPDPRAWDAFVAAHPDGHTLQLAAWGMLKSRFGWRAQTVALMDSAERADRADQTDRIAAGALILFRPLPLRLGTMAYIPAGPLFGPDVETDRALWSAIRATASRQRAAFVKVEPCDYYRPRPDLAARLAQAGLRPSPQTVQPPRTIVIDLTADEAAILKRMNQSTRYKCRLGQKKDVTVRMGTRDDVASFNALMAVTGERDAFGVHAPDYYQAAYDLFAPEGRCALLIASYAGQDLAGVMVFRCGENACYLYGASSNAERSRMPTYIVQWEAIRWAKAAGAKRYDLWGIPDADETTLEAEFENRHDGLWGVYGFKRGFGGVVVRSVGAWDKPYLAPLYAAYRWHIARREKAES